MVGISLLLMRVLLLLMIEILLLILLMLVPLLRSFSGNPPPLQPLHLHLQQLVQAAGA